MFCGSCGKQLIEGSKFCNHCGAAVNGNARSSSVEVSVSDKTLLYSSLMQKSQNPVATMIGIKLGEKFARKWFKKKGGETKDS